MAIIDYYEETRDENGKLLAVTSNTNLPTPSEVRNRWCFGLPLNKEDGEVIPDEDILQYLRGAIRTVERKLGIFLKPTKVMTNPDERGLVEGEDYEKAESAYDYDARVYKQYGFLQLKERPVQSIEKFQMVLPNGNVIIDFTRDADTRQWIKLYNSAGQLHIVPYAGDPTIFAMMGGSQSGYPFMTGQINRNLPQMFYADYTAGYKLYQVPEDVRNAIAKMASMDILGIAGDAVLAGVASQSTSIDGLSESTSTTASATSATYNAHILQYQKEVDNLFNPKNGGLRSSERGITMIGL